MRRPLAALGYLGCFAAPIACSRRESYIWYSQLTPEALPAANEYVIGVGNTLNVRVLGRDEMATSVKMRADGRIAVPIIDEVEARGKRPAALRAEIEGRLKDYIVIPSVTLNVDETSPVAIGCHIRRRSMSFTTNKHPSRWGHVVLHDDDLAAAIVRCILERGRLLRLDRPSLRTRAQP